MSELNILFIGDIVGETGRRMVKNFLPVIKNEYKIDLVIANGENVAGGFGITKEKAEELFRAGVDVMTSGNHIWNKKEILNFIENETRILRPANFPSIAPGKGSTIIAVNSFKIGVINLQGRIFMEPINSPFEVAMQEIEKIKKETNIIIVDFHAEATSEKTALGWFLDGKVSAIIGTHTHVMTADERILPNGSAYITDVGMTGAKDSVIGIKKELALVRFLKSIPQRLEAEKGKG
ncbi:MAG: TIGR00282 family metallophosphoesterase, partial [Candidatus Aminicenantia bacterium]